MKEYNSSRSMVYAEYKRPKKKIISLEERQREKNSLKVYRPNGDDAS